MHGHGRMADEKRCCSSSYFNAGCGRGVPREANITQVNTSPKASGSATVCYLLRVGRSLGGPGLCAPSCRCCCVLS